MHPIKTLLTFDNVENYNNEITWTLYGIGRIVYSVDPDAARGKDFCVHLNEQSDRHSEAFTTWELAEKHMLSQINRMMSEAIQEIDAQTKRYLALSRTIG